jgi:hypothetical protein
MRLGFLLAHLSELEVGFASELRAAAQKHRDDHDVYHQCLTFAVTADKRVHRLEPLLERYRGRAEWTSALAPVEGADLLARLRVLYLESCETAITWTMAVQASKAVRDQDLLKLGTKCESELHMQAKWFMTRIKVGAPQALVVA